MKLNGIYFHNTHLLHFKRRNLIRLIDVLWLDTIIFFIDTITDWLIIMFLHIFTEAMQ